MCCVKGHCPDCGVLHEITPTGEEIPGKERSRYWQLVVHSRNGEICPGSGKKV